MAAKKFFSGFMLSASAIFCSSCVSDDAGIVKDIEVTTDTIASEVRVNFDLIRVNIPSPASLTNKLTEAGINYNKNILNAASRAGNYTTNYQKAINLGVFGADLGFSAAYNQPQDALEYLNQMGKLATDLGISSAFDPEFSKKLIQNVGKPDTFQLMLDTAFRKAERNLRSNQRVTISALMVTGGWIEGLYLAVESASSNPTPPNAPGLYNQIYTHCHAFKYVFELLEAFKDNADCIKLLQEMEPEKPVLLSIGNNPKIGPANLPKLREAVSALRNKIIS